MLGSLACTELRPNVAAAGSAFTSSVLNLCECSCGIMSVVQKELSEFGVQSTTLDSALCPVNTAYDKGGWNFPAVNDLAVSCQVTVGSPHDSS